MRKLVLLPLFVLLAVTTVYGQYNTPQNKVWTFGNGAGLNFNTGSPVAITSSINTTEGCASVSDASGNLLFYSDGVNVYQASGTIMASGSSIVPFNTSSTTQGCLIVPVIGNPNQYYLFSMEEYMGGTGYCHLDYCIVDMSLGGGLGDVVASTLGTPVTDQLAEKMIAIEGNSCNIWLVTHKKDEGVFLAYSITSTGISATPVISTTGSFTGTDCYTIGVIKATNDRSKIVAQVYSVGSAMGTELYDFNPNTGVVSNCRTLDNTDNGYGAEFSPDGTKLYAETWSGTVTQYDVTLATTSAIIASATTVISSFTYSDMKLAADGKIYIQGSGGPTTLDCIPNPNTSGTSCGLTSPAVTLTGSATMYDGLPNLVVAAGSGGDTTIRHFDTTLCLVAGATVLETADTTGNSYLWSNGTSTATDNLNAYGTFWLVINNGCDIRLDTFKVHPLPTDTSYTRADTSVCSNTGAITIHAPGGYANYLWASGTTGSSISAASSGYYVVFAGTGCHVLEDSINVNITPYLLTSSSRDTLYCFPGELSLIAPTGYGLYTWQDGSVSTTFTATSGGTYYVDESSYCADHIDTFHVIPTSFSINIGNDTTVCMNDRIALDIPGDDVHFTWQDGSHDSAYSADHTGSYFVTVQKGGCVASDTINVTFDYLSENIPDTFVCKNTPFAYHVTCNVPDGGSV